MTLTLITKPGVALSENARLSPNLVLGLGFHYYFQNQENKATEYFTKFNELYGDNEVSLRFLGKIYLRKKRADLALKYLHRAIKADSKSITSLLLIAETYLGLRDLKNAIVAFEKVFKIEPFHERAIISLAMIYSELKKNRRASIYFRRLVLAVNKHGGGNIQFLHRAFASLGNYYYQEGNYKKAIYYYKKLLTLNHKSIRVQLILGELYKITGQFEEAKKVLTNLLKIKPDYKPAIDSLIEAYYITGDARALRLINILSKDTKSANPLLRAMLQELKHQDKSAEVNFQLILKENSNRLSAHIGLVRVYERQKKYSELKKEAFSVVILAQRIGANKIARKYISQVLSIMQKESERIQFDKKFFVASSNTPLLLSDAVERLAYDYIEVYATHAETLDGLGKARKAVVYFTASLRYLEQVKKWYLWQEENLTEANIPSLQKKMVLLQKKKERIRNREYHILLSSGWLLQEKSLSRFDKALRMQSRAKKIRPEKPQADFLSGIILFNMGENQKLHYNRAISHLQEAIRLSEQDASKKKLPGSYFFYLGMALEKNDRFPEAEVKLKRAIDLDPYNSTYLNYLGYMYSLRNIKLNEATNLLVRALEDDPENEAYLDSLGWIFYQEGKYKDALQQLLQAANHSEKHERADSVIYFHLAETYFQLKDYSLSHFYYSKSLTYIDKASEDIDEKYIRTKIQKIESNKKNK